MKSPNHPMTYAEKILQRHLSGGQDISAFRRGEDYAFFRPDRVAMQDATAQMAVLQFMNAGKESVAVPTSIHCDHLICARDGAVEDVPAALRANAEVYEFLRSAASCYGMDFWKPGAGIIHQIVLENYAFPGGMMIGTDSHTPNAGGLGMIAIGVGGADAVDVMSGMDWELKVPRIIGVHLKGSLKGWASPKDIILKLAGILTVKGGTNAIIEYFGEGCSTISATGKATICNMGAEVGATCSVFPYDRKMSDYLRATGRASEADKSDAQAQELCADPEVLAAPERYFDRIIEIDLDALRPYVNGPFTPDAANELGHMEAYVREKDYPEEVSVALIGSCTNSSYQDLSRAASVAEWFLSRGLKPKASLIVNPGSERIKATARRDGILETLEKAGAIIMANACGPCIGQWERKTSDPTAKNTIVTSFNRNFSKRADGNPNTHAFIVSPETAVALAFTGSLTKGVEDLPAPSGAELPPDGFAPCDMGLITPEPGKGQPIIREGSERLQKLEPFGRWDGKDFLSARLLIKVSGKCTTDHISMAGPWLKYRGHLQNISRNLLMGATNAFNGKTNAVLLHVGEAEKAAPGKDAMEAAPGKEVPVSEAALVYREEGFGSVIVAGENYGEGSSREHAAMEPRYLGVKAVMAKSFARIHETNLKKQGVLALVFANPGDYDLVREGDTFDIHCSGIRPGQPVNVTVRHSDGTADTFQMVHTYNEQQLSWFRAGSALNSLKDGNN